MVRRAGMMIALFFAACAPEETGVREPFIAVERDFQDFRDWPRMELPPSSLTMSHGSGTRWLYFSDVPDGPGAPFPLRTMLVKTVEEGDPTTWEIHAMVKRGGDYNAEGARGWEFFDLALDAEDAVFVRWRGEGPPPGTMGYAGEGTGDGLCNGCHGLFPDRDYVLDRPLFD